MSESLFFQDLAVMMAVVGLVSVIFTRLGWPKVIGYLLAGVMMSEHTWGGSFLADPKSIGTIGQLGIVFLMFTLGLEFSADDMKKVKHVTIPTAIFDTLMMIWLGYTMGTRVLGWDGVQSLFLGAALCDSATTLLAKTIEEMRCLVTGVATGDGMSMGAVGLSLGGLLVFFTGVLVFGLVLAPRLLNGVASLKDDETLLLTVLGLCFFVSFIAFKFDYSLALGAFLVGILGASSDVRNRLHKLASPLRNMFSAVFFVTIGLLVDPRMCLSNLPLILGLVLLVVLGKGFNCCTMSLLTGQSVKNAVQTGLGLAQIGEFAYMVALIYMTQTGDAASPIYQVVVAVSLITTCLNPTLLRASDRVGDWCETHLPERLRGWIAAYQDWLARFRGASVPTQLQKHLRSRFAWLVAAFMLNFAVVVAATMLPRLDYSPFSRFSNDHKLFFFCLVANLFCVSMLALMLGLALSIGRDIAAVLTGTRQPKKWKAAVRQFVSWACWTVVLVLAFVQNLMINVNLLPPEPPARLTILALLATAAILGWKHFKRAGHVATYRFNSALAAERRRTRRATARGDVTLTVPGDFYEHLAIPEASPAIGESIRSLDIRAKTGASVVAVERAGNRFRNPGPSWTFEAGDVAVVIGDPPQLAALRSLLSAPSE